MSSTTSSVRDEISHMERCWVQNSKHYEDFRSPLPWAWLAIRPVAAKREVKALRQQ